MRSNNSNQVLKLGWGPRQTPVICICIVLTAVCLLQIKTIGLIICLIVYRICSFLSCSRRTQWLAELHITGIERDWSVMVYGTVESWLTEAKQRVLSVSPSHYVRGFTFRRPPPPLPAVVPIADPARMSLRWPPVCSVQIVGADG